MAILGVHELGHYVTARYYRAAVSLPYFIPAPLGFGTLGAIILMRSPARDPQLALRHRRRRSAGGPGGRVPSDLPGPRVVERRAHAARRL
jgi:membrane-associated protease RseP (regulator of RpoE activity)